ncbi:hypothetical protein ACSSWA_14170 [Melioribacter sp. Ez-97]|uniref:hypothetical protein n=1 Tax=Melioribacter sp. Ez-97 TaxID=3423434 RepID=UPI003EDAE227
MVANRYNDDEQKYSKLIEDLKRLPRVNTDDNFEYVLMTRIRNGNFGNASESERIQFGLIRFLAPTAVVATVIVLFVLFLPGEQNYEDPLMSEPQVIISELDHQSVSSPQETEPPVEKKIQTEENSFADKIEEPQGNVRNYPILPGRSVELDDYIAGKNYKRSNLLQGSVVKAGENVPEFDGFFVRQNPDPEMIRKYRKMIDSLKRAADSSRLQKEIK